MSPCTTFPEFTEYQTAVNTACCGEGEACVAGMPTECKVDCASALIPMQLECADFLTMIGMKSTVDQVAAMCATDVGSGCGH